MKVLVVREAFGDYAKGDMITDPDAMAKVEADGQVHHCTPTEVDDSFFAEAAKTRGKAAE
jgi:hypothetical protein